jgi:DNA-binding transcriptional regulator YhcF (GntR family)
VTERARGAVKYRPRLVDLVLDKESTIPLYLQLKQHIIHLISSGAWGPGTSLPSVRQLASDLGMATATVQRAYNELRAQGLLVGQAGRGVYVGELATRLPGLAAERTEVLNGLLGRAVTHARSLGFAETEIVAAVRGLLGDGKLSTTQSRVVFVGWQRETVDKYVRLLREALLGLDVAVDGVALAELQRDDATLERLEPIRCIVTLIGSFADVRRLTGPRGTPLFGLVVELTEATQHALVHLPEEVPIGLVAEQRYLTSARALLRQYFGNEERVRWTVPRNHTAMRRILQECPIIVHTFGAKKTLEEHAPPEVRLIELEYMPNAASLARLRTLLASEHAAGPSPQPPEPPSIGRAQHLETRREILRRAR